jgi:hypothetical protein
MWLAVVVVAAGLAYVTYRLGLTVRAIRSDVAATLTGRKQLRTNAFTLQRGVVGVTLVALVVLVVVALVAK